MVVHQSMMLEPVFAYIFHGIKNKEKNRKQAGRLWNDFHSPDLYRKHGRYELQRSYPDCP